MKKLILVTLLLYISFLNKTLYSQEYKFQQFSMQNGLNDPFIYTLQQDDRGYLLVGTGEGLGIFNGVSFEMKYTEDGLAENFISEIFKSKNNIVWLGHKEGSISTMRRDKINPFNLSKKFESLITGISEDSYGNIWISSQSNGIVRITTKDNSELRFEEEFEDLIINEVNIHQTKLYVSTSAGLKIYDIGKDKLYLSQTINEDVNITKTIFKNDTTVIIGSMADGVFSLNIKTSLSKQLDLPDGIIVKDLTRDKHQNIYISTINEGIIKYDTLEINHLYNSENGLQTNAINTCFIDREDNIWLGSYGSGIFKHSQEIFTYYFSPKEGKNNEVKDILNIGKRQYFAFNNHIIMVDSNDFNKPDTIHLNVESNVSSIWTDNNDYLWIGTSNFGLLYYNADSKIISSFEISTDLLTKNITAIQGCKDDLWIGTLNGVYQYKISLDEYTKYDISNGLSHNSVNAILLDSTCNKVYVGCKSSSLSVIQNEQIFNFSYSADNRVINIYDIIQLSNGKIAMATYGNGIFIYNDTVFENYTINDGLNSNFCYGIIEDLKNDIWITHNGALSRFSQEDLSFQVYSEDEGVSLRYLKSSLSSDNYDIWYGTEQGVLKFNTFIDNINYTPPLVSVFSLQINGENKDVVSEITLRPGSYDFKIEMRGLSLKNPKAVLFKHKLEGYNEEWSDITEGESIRFSKIPDGTYYLKIVAYNNDMIGSKPDIYLKIIIETPYWKKIWFWALMGVILAGIIFGIFKYRTRQYRLRQIELEKQLVIRTKEVTDEKRKVEVINKDITDSINYAKRIQDALLPSIDGFQKMFPESFVIYQPRDIVSGDFFWTGSKDGKFLLGCGDCTGHGVPGAFMSLLGQQTLREIHGIKGLVKPHKILKELNVEIKSLMKIDNTDEFKPSDGMDIIIGEFDMKTKILDWSSALRPLVLYRNGERQYFKGSRYSIGSAPINAEYEQFQLQLEDGDVLYFFSDGFPDQFGGLNAKKLKTSGMFKIMDEANSLDMKSQKKYIKSEVRNWMGDLDQTDDIIIIGIKI